MSECFRRFEDFARRSANVGKSVSLPDIKEMHPFDERNIHPEIGKVAQPLFDDGHYSQATFEVFKFIDLQVKKLSGINDSGYALMMKAFGDNNTKIKLTDMSTQSEIDEQSGYKNIFAGAMSAIRNPRGHEINADPIDRCLDHLTFASVLLRRLEERVHPKP